MTDLLELGNYTILSPHPHSHDPGNAGKGKGKERPVVAIHHQTGEEFEIVSFPRSELTPQKVAELQQELLIAQRLKAFPNLRLLVEVLDHPECVFLLYTTAHSRARGKRSPSPVSLYHSDSSSEYPTAAPFPPGEIPLLEYVMKSGRLEEDEAKVIFVQLARLVLSCHQNLVVLRDLKLPSILIDPATKVLRLADFKQATLLDSPDQLLTDRRGSPAYVSPDVLIGKPYSGQKADSWSLGVVLYAMLCGNFPFIGPTPKEIFQRILTSPPAYPSHLSQQASALVQGLLRPSTATRLAVHEALNHPWLSFDDDEDQVVPDF